MQKEVALSLEDVKEDTRKLLEKEQRLEEVTLSLEAVKEENSRLLLTCSSLAEQVQHTFSFTRFTASTTDCFAIRSCLVSPFLAVLFFCHRTVVHCIIVAQIIKSIPEARTEFHTTFN